MNNRHRSVVIFFMRTDTGFSIINHDITYTGEFSFDVYEETLDAVKKKYSNPNIAILSVIHFPDGSETGWIQ